MSSSDSSESFKEELPSGSLFNENTTEERIPSKIIQPWNLKIGLNSAWSDGCWFNCWGGLTIGDDVIIGPFVVIHTANHKFNRLDIPIRLQGWTLKPVVIENDVWIGANATILAGVTIGKGSVIAAGAVVTHDIPVYSVAAGVPAKVIYNRKS